MRQARRRLASVVVALAVLLPLLVAADAAPSAGEPSREPQECLWVQIADVENSNVLYPDTAVNYYLARVTVPPGGELRLEGRFPHARYLSFNAYDELGRPTDALADRRIEPDRGSTNPYVVGQRRDVAMRSYTVRVVPAPAPDDPADRERNTVYLGSEGRAVHSGSIIYRVYLPDRGRDEFGDTGLPQGTLRLADGRELEQPLACSAGSDQPSTGINAVDRSSDGPVTPNYGAAQDPLLFQKFFNAGRGIATTFSNDVAERMSGDERGGFFSDGNNSYVSAPTSRDLGEVIVIEGRIPDTVDTYGGDRRFEDAQLRYWSMCHTASLAAGGVTDTVGCVFDEQVPQGPRGEFTVVISTPDDRPANARAECGVAWLPFGARPNGVVIMRNQLPSPDFGQAIAKVAEPGDEAEVMGPYLPRGSYTSTDTFEQRGCSPSSPSGSATRQRPPASRQPPVASRVASNRPGYASPAGATAKASTASSVAMGPPGDAFYYPPSSRLAGPPGTVIWARPLTNEAALPGADNWLVLYRSQNPQGDTVAVSGTVAIPHGQAPHRGWPVMSWTHGTTGNADHCAPSRLDADHPVHSYVSLMNETLTKWSQRGYAVTKTDYHGLGTDGVHGYDIGIAEARATVDITRAAHELSGDLSRSWVVNGHSQGGHAALFTAEIGRVRAPELDLRGAVAQAAPSQLRDLLRVARNMPRSTVVGYFPLLIRGIETVADLNTREILTPKAWELLPHADTRCIPGLYADDSFGGMKNNEVFLAGADMSTFDRVIHENDPAHLAPGVPVLLTHGGQDDVLPHAMSDALFAQFTAKGTDVEYRFYPTDDHRSVVATSYEDVAAWVDAVMASE